MVALLFPYHTLELLVMFLLAQGAPSDRFLPYFSSGSLQVTDGCAVLADECNWTNYLQRWPVSS
jgi:hypothetical protein